LSNLPIYFKSIAGIPFEDQLSVARRWLMKEVGLREDGTANDCLIIYDYIKLMDSKELSKNMAEYQSLGFIMTGWHNFAVRYDVPIFMLAQASREGIENEGTDVIAGSDRIGWLCSSATLFKPKSPEEIESDGPEHGNMKLVVL